MANKISVREHAQSLGISKQAILKRVIKGLPIRGIKSYYKVGELWVLIKEN
jgi:hypothetical protein